jgi:hypothetical protein
MFDLSSRLEGENADGVHTIAMPTQCADSYRGHEEKLVVSN